MKAAYVFVCFALLVVVGVTAQSAIPAPRFNVDLDAPASTRWLHVYDHFKNSYGPMLEWYNRLIPPAVQAQLEPLLEQVVELVPSPYKEEMKSIASQSVHIGLNLAKVFVLNVVYDITAGCGAVVAEKANGVIYHGRNLDYGVPGLLNLTAQIDFKRNGQVLFTATHFMGYVGVLTGMRPNGWSVNLNQRDMDSASNPLDNIIAALTSGAKPSGFYLREALETYDNYEDALMALQHGKMMASSYLILAGKQSGEGAIITREGMLPQDVKTLNPRRKFLVQTNYDHWTGHSDPRRKAAEQAVAKYLPNNITHVSMLDVMNTKPTFNTGTIYTNVISAGDNVYTTLVRHDRPRAAIAQDLEKKSARLSWLPELVEKLASLAKLNKPLMTERAAV